eukprot:COSAG06_NODE_367_length_16758_cov_27.111651_2_plen_52_part_00
MLPTRTLLALVTSIRILSAQRLRLLYNITAADLDLCLHGWVYSEGTLLRQY